MSPQYICQYKSITNTTPIAFESWRLIHWCMPFNLWPQNWLCMGSFDCCLQFISFHDTIFPLYNIVCCLIFIHWVYTLDYAGLNISPFWGQLNDFALRSDIRTKYNKGWPQKGQIVFVVFQVFSCHSLSCTLCIRKSCFESLYLF